MIDKSGTSRTVESSQNGPHDKLDELVRRYQQYPSQRPISEHTQQAFDKTMAWLGDWQGDIILDSCCGVGQSTARIAEANPDAKVIGLDKSAVRIAKHSYYQGNTENYWVQRADVIDFWRLLHRHNIAISQHFLLYPNPYPKASQVKKRWHGSAAFVDLMKLTGNIEVRSNWLIYLMEFAQAAGHYGLQGDIKPVDDTADFTPFERKYRASGQICWQLCCQPDEGC
ncbi:tRNA (guanine(46)-N(7))-methyltransferase TrmB [Salinimonas chungwhensis]|uniref:tRNA (guanine(46)-N(7))-methyltransferase TrmB n=1 Tax=Salinimonas chungwhensis TaxID=265425 RepID=UPI0003624829|nr:hypothetical protein [Salinimonas chungwhensis]